MAIKPEIKRKRGRPRKIDNTLSPAAVEQIDEIEDLLEELPANYKVTVDRVEPDWCAGYCGKFFVSTATRVSLEDIKRRFGGRVFRVKIFNESGQLSKQRLISIDEMPRREGKPINMDGTTVEDKPEPKEKAPQKTDYISELLASNLPAESKQRMISMLSGFPVYSPPAPPQPEKDPKEQLQVYQMINDMMQSNRDSQAKMARANMELLEAVFDLKMKTAQASAPTDPLNQLNQTIELVRAMNGVQSELRPPGDESLASQVINNSMPMLQGVLSDFMSLKKAQVQAELQKNIAVQNNRPEIPARVPPGAPRMPRIASGTDSDPVSAAREMAAMFRSLSQDEQTLAMSEFFSALEQNDGGESITDHNYMEKIVDAEKFGTIGDIDILPADDRDVLKKARGGNGNQAQTDHVPDRNGPGATENDDPADRPGDTPGIGFPTN